MLTILEIKYTGGFKQVFWYLSIGQQSTVEASTFGADFSAMNVGIEIIAGLQYTLSIFGVPIYGSSKLYCDNEAV